MASLVPFIFCIKSILITHLRTFGSRCFPLLKDSSSHKLAPKSLPCVFLGYSDRHKGYKCFYPATGKFFISCSVVFDESCFPYHDLQTLHKPSSDSYPTITLFSKTAPPIHNSSLRHPSVFDHEPCPVSVTEAISSPPYANHPSPPSTTSFPDSPSRSHATSTTSSPTHTIPPHPHLLPYLLLHHPTTTLIQ